MPEWNEKQQAIIEAASHLIMAQGVENTSLGDIAREVGISKGTLYYYYASKADLIFDVTEYHFSQVTQGLLSWVGTVEDVSNPTEIFRVVLQTILQAQTRARLHIYLLQSMMEEDARLRARFQQKYQEWQTMIQAGLDALFGQRAEHAALAALVLAAIDGFVIQSYLGIDPIPADAVISWLASKV